MSNIQIFGNSNVGINIIHPSGHFQRDIGTETETTSITIVKVPEYKPNDSPTTERKNQTIPKILTELIEDKDFLDNKRYIAVIANAAELTKNRIPADSFVQAYISADNKAEAQRKIHEFIFCWNFNKILSKT